MASGDQKIIKTGGSLTEWFTTLKLGVRGGERQQELSSKLLQYFFCLPSGISSLHQTPREGSALFAHSFLRSKLSPPSLENDSHILSGHPCHVGGGLSKQ